MMLRTAAFTTLLLAATGAAAQTFDRNGLFIYGAGGVSLGNDDAANLDRANAAVGGVTSSSVDTRRNTLRAGVGYRFNQFWGVEGGYVDVGRIEINASGPGGSYSSNTKLRGGQVALVGYLPLGDSNFDLFGKIGALYTRTEFTDSAGADEKETNWRNYWGLGLQYQFNRSVFGRLEFERYQDVGGANLGGKNSFNQYHIGVGYKF